MKHYKTKTGRYLHCIQGGPNSKGPGVAYVIAKTEPVLSWYKRILNVFSRAS